MRTWAAFAMAVIATTAGVAATLTAVSIAGSAEERDAYGLNEIARNGNVQGVLYPGDPIAEAKLVAREDERIVYVRRVASAAYWTLSVDAPYRFRTGAGFTLVLPARDAPYTLDDLKVLAPQTLVVQPDGSYLLRESVAVMQGATLSLRGVTLRLQSDAQGFSSIVAFGGRLDMAGSAEAPVDITSWDSAADGPDTDTTDGRAYVRVIGGSASLSHTDMTDLGFWGGSTGGFAITGNDDADDTTLAASMQNEEPAEDSPTGAPVVDPSGIFLDAAEDPAFGVGQGSTVQEGAAPRPSLPELGLSTATIADSTMSGNAFGIFVSSARDVTVSRTSVTGSLVDGITFHRAVTHSEVSDSTSSDNAVDGVSLGRSTSGVTLREVVASRNGRNGVSIDGQSLADGPSASGTAVATFGDNAVVDGTVAGNGRYGVEISGGRRIQVRGNLFSGNPDGVVVARDADAVDVADNDFDDQSAASIAVRDGVTGVAVVGNRIRGGDTGIHVRNAVAEVRGNVVTDVANHGVTLVGTVRGSVVEGNDLGGTGRTAVRAEDATGALVGENDLERWRPAVTVASVVGFVFQPLTIVWLLLGLLLVITALTRKDRQYGKIRDPYAERVPLTSLSPGIVSIDAIQRAEAS